MHSSWLLAATVVVVCAKVAAAEFTNQFELGGPSTVLNGRLGSMRQLRMPQPGDDGTGTNLLSDFVRDQKAIVVLGKALFWDQSVGSDGIACASCHFHAGADDRVKNQLDPDLRGVGLPSAPVPFHATRSGNTGGPNYTLTTADFPFHVLVDPLDRNSAVLFDTPDVASSQGVFATQFVNTGRRYDQCYRTWDPTFMLNGIQTRRVEPRNTPTAIGAAFNFRNFWDGRANNHFNGSSPFGPRDPDAGVFELQSDGSVRKVRVDLSNSSAASQAVGPPGSDFEMSCAGRIFPDIAHRILRLRALATQEVSKTDGVLGPYVAKDGVGLTPTYKQLISNAFRPAYWSATQNIVLDPADPAGSTYTQMEANFALFFGLAIQEYEKTLIPDQTRFDAYAEAAFAAQRLDVPGLTDQERHGLAIFEGDGIDTNQRFAPDGKCSRCHLGPEFSSAATHQQALQREGGLVERMAMNDGLIAIYDSGFYNIGVVPTSQDLGLGVNDPWGNPLGFARQAKAQVAATGIGLECWNTPVMSFGPDPFAVNCNSFVEPGPIYSWTRDATDGAFKVPTLRNIELTGPYFHNGGAATLEQVVAFYNRGGNRRGPAFEADTTGFGPNASNLDPDVEVLFLTPSDQAALVAFLRTLTDPRVVDERAPFDHPGLKITNGHQGDNVSVKSTPDGRAKDQYLTLPAVGAAGRAAQKLPPLRPFLQ